MCHPEAVGFHFVMTYMGSISYVMSYMGSIGYVTSDADINACWEVVYAGNSVAHMMTGHTYSLALGAHLFSSALLMSDLHKYQVL